MELLRTRVWNFGKILLLAGALAITFFLFAGIAMRVAVRARQVTVPNLIGLNGDRAADVMRSRGFRVTITSQSVASTIPPGVVVRQAPQGGHQVHPGDSIGLEVSR